jgi:hypothetical protein
MALGVAHRFAFERHASPLCENAVPAAVRKVEQKAERHPNDEPFQATAESFDSNHRENPIPARGIQGTRGVLKVRRTPGRVRRSTMIARQMITKAESVPMFTN